MTGVQRDHSDQRKTSEFTSELARDLESREAGKSLRPLRRLVPFLLAYPGLLTGFLIFFVLAAAFTLTLPAAFRAVIDCGFGGAQESQFCSSLAFGDGLSVYFLGGMGVAILLGLASALRYYFVSVLGERVVADIRCRVYDHLLSLSMDFYARVQTSEITSRLTTDTTLVQSVVGSSISIALRSFATMIGALVLMVFLNWQLATTIIAIGILVLLPIRLFGRRVRRLSRSGQDSVADASVRANETLRAISTVQAFNRESEEKLNFASSVEEAFNVSKRRIRVRAFMTAFVFAVGLSAFIGGLWYAATYVRSGDVSPGAMTQFVMYAFVAVSGIGILTETYSEIMRASGATERLMELLEERSAIALPSAVHPLPKQVRGVIEFDDVKFSYPTRGTEQAIVGVSFKVDAGERIALIGSSGAGKSTLFQLLLRFYDPQSGRVLLDGTDIREFDPQKLRSVISVVQQNAPLFSGTVRDNIRFGRSNASDDEVERAAEAASASEFIRQLSDGYDTDLGDSAINLSGGERQRLAIARAILRDTPILLLDEATNALDSENEQAIQSALETLSKGRTTIVITHRASTVVKTDRVLFMEDGKLSDQGSYDSRAWPSLV